MPKPVKNELLHIGPPRSKPLMQRLMEAFKYSEELTYDQLIQRAKVCTHNDDRTFRQFLADPTKVQMVSRCPRRYRLVSADRKAS